jgi:hypothetical protein
LNHLGRYAFQLGPAVPTTVNQVPTSSDFTKEISIIIKQQRVFRLAQIKSSDLTISRMTVCCFDPPFPSSMFNCSKSPRLSNLTISTKQFRARLIDNPERLIDGNVLIGAQQFFDIQNIWDKE